MKYQEAENLVWRMRYTPGTTFKCIQPVDPADRLYGGAVIKITFPCKDSGAPDQDRGVERWLYLCDIELAHLTPALLVKRVQLYLYALAQHEVDEFFEVDRMKVSEPHPEYHGEARTYKVAL